MRTAPRAMIAGAVVIATTAGIESIERGLDPLFGPLGRSPVARARGLDASQYLRLALDTDVYCTTMSIFQMSQHKECKAQKRQ